ncbi:hypothetical protein NMG60_11015241 [Bertholletia excelsa]
MNSLTLFQFLLLLVLPVRAGCTSESESGQGNSTEALKYKVAAIASILIASAIGVSLPILGKIIPAFHPRNHIFLAIKAFAGGVILATGFVHVLPDAFQSLSSPCLGHSPWGNFPLTGLVAMLSAIATMMLDTSATSYFNRSHFEVDDHKAKAIIINGDEESNKGEHQGHVHVHTHATHGHAHGSSLPLQGDLGLAHLIRFRIVSQVLEAGIVVHSVIIGVSLGASESPKTIKPLVAALTFHQFFEGMGLGGCISQAQFKAGAIGMMVIFFSLTTPIGIAVGYGISKMYNENGPRALIVQGIFNSASAGILIYMALVDLLAADFMNPIMQTHLRLQFASYLSLLAGAASMSLLALWT